MLSQPLTAALEWTIRPAYCPTRGVAFMRSVPRIAEGKAPETRLAGRAPAIYTAGTSAQEGDLSMRVFPVYKDRRVASLPITGQASASLCDAEPEIAAATCVVTMHDLEEWLIERWPA